MKTLYLALASLLTVSILAVAPLSADVVLLYDIGSGNSSGVASTPAANVSASSLSMNGVNPMNSNINGVFAAKSWGSNFNSNDYIEFTITPGAGFEIAYDSLSLALFRQKQNNNKFGPDEWSLKASTDGFGTSVVDLVDFDISSSGSYEQVAFNVDISALGTLSDAVTFRLYGYGSTQSSRYGGLGNNPNYSGTGSDLIVYGALVAAPEPGTLLIMGGALAALVARRKSKK